MILCETLTGCGIEEPGKFVDSYKVAVIDSDMHMTNGSNIEFFDDQLENTGKKNISYSAIGDFGFQDPCVYNGKMYVASLGDTLEKDFGKIISMDLITGDTEEYDFDRTGINSIAVNDQYIYAVTNLNMTTYVDQYSFKTGKIKTFKIADKAAMYFTLVGEDIYVYMIECDEKNDIDYDVVYKVNVEDETSKKVVSLKEWETSVVHTVEYDGKIYILNEDKLLILDTEKETVEEVELPCEDGWGMERQQEKLYIASVDFHDEDSETDLMIYDIKSGKVENTCHIKEAAMQFEVDQDEIYVLSLKDELIQYKITDQKLKELQRVVIKSADSNHAVSAMFLKR